MVAKRTSAAKKKKSPKASSKKAKAPSKKTKAPSKKAKVSKKKKTTPKKPVSDEKVSIDRRREERRDDEMDDAVPQAKPMTNIKPRAKVNRRRQIDPTTCERDYTDQEVAFMNAMDEYKRNSGRMFPTCSEVLEVIRDLGYVQLSEAELAARRPTVSLEVVPLETEDASIAEVADASEAGKFAGGFSSDSDDHSSEFATALTGDLSDF